MKQIKSPFDSLSIKKGLDYVKYNGISGVVSKVKYRMTGPGLAYNGWYKENHEVDEEELIKQRQAEFYYSPLISILVPVYLTPEFYLRAMIESVRVQSYSNWELCIVDGSQAKVEEQPVEKTTAYDFVYSLETERIIRELTEEDERIKYHLLEKNAGICGSLSKALSMASGEYVVFLNHDDLLTEDALYEIVKACNEKKYDFLYSDEDKCSSDGTKYSDPNFKPDFSLDLLRAYNYFGHLTAVKRSLAMRVSFRPEFEGAEDYDFNLRCMEMCIDGLSRSQALELNSGDMAGNVAVKPLNSDKVKHISRVLYHSRIKTRRLADSGHRRNVSGETAKKALSMHLERAAGYATAVRTDMKGIFKVAYETPGNPKISIIINPSKNVSLMEKCIVPLFEKARYSDFEVIIVETVENMDKEMTVFYRQLEGKRSNIKVLSCNSECNAAARRNIGARHAKGDYLMFIDGELELMDVTAIGDMLGNCMRAEVGVVGGTLYTMSDVIYKQGIILGVNGFIAYPYRGVKKGDYGYLKNNCINCNYTAVPAACMMTKTVLFDKLGGFDERLSGDAAAIDFCIAAGKLGLLTVTLADAGWIYHDKIKRNRASGIDERNQNMLEEKWKDVFSAPDPFYNVNYSRQGELFTL